MKKIIIAIFSLALFVGCKNDRYHVIVKEVSQDYFYNMQPGAGGACAGCYSGSIFVIQYTKDNWETSTFYSGIGSRGVIMHMGWDKKEDAIRVAKSIVTIGKCELHEKRVSSLFNEFQRRQDSSKAAYQKSLITIIK